MDIKQPGVFTRSRIILGRPAPHITPDSLVQELQHVFGPRGFEVYKSALIGADVALKKSGWTGVVFKIKNDKGLTEIVYNAYAPSAFVRVMFMGLIPALIVNASSWKPLLRDFEAYVRTSNFWMGNQLAAGGPAPLPQAVAHFPQQHQQHWGAPPPQQQYQQQPQQQQFAPPPGQPCMQCGTPMNWVAEQNRWWCGRCQQLR